MSLALGRGGDVRVDAGPVGGGRGAGPRDVGAGAADGRGGLETRGAAFAGGFGALDGRGTFGADTRCADGGELGRGGAWLGRTAGGGDVRAVGRGAASVSCGRFDAPAAGRPARPQFAHKMIPRASGTGLTTCVPQLLHKTAIAAAYQQTRARRRGRDRAQKTALDQRVCARTTDITSSSSRL